MCRAVTAYSGLSERLAPNFGVIHMLSVPPLQLHHANCRFMLITPLHSTQWDKPVLVNRGWVPSSWRSDAEFRQQWEASGDVSLEAVTRVNEDPSSFVPENNPRTGEWFWIDIPAMATSLGLPADTPLVEVSLYCLYLVCIKHAVCFCSKSVVQVSTRLHINEVCDKA